MINIQNILNKYESKQYILQNPKQIRQGKEATVFVVLHQGKRLALKVYIDPALRAFQKNQIYIEGKFYRKSSERRAVAKKNTFGKAILHQNWVRREYYLLNKVAQLGATVPKVYAWTSESILMDFIGDDSVAPRLIEVKLDQKNASTTLELILRDVERLMMCGVIHGDLSAYNILWWQDKPWIIDLPQAIDIRHNPHRDDLLKRDLENILQYFASRCDCNQTNIYARFHLGV